MYTEILANVEVNIIPYWASFNAEINIQEHRSLSRRLRDAPLRMSAGEARNITAMGVCLSDTVLFKWSHNMFLFRSCRFMVLSPLAKGLNFVYG